MSPNDSTHLSEAVHTGLLNVQYKKNIEASFIEAFGWLPNSQFTTLKCLVL